MDTFRRATYAEISNAIREIADVSVELGQPAGD